MQMAAVMPPAASTATEKSLFLALCSLLSQILLSARKPRSGMVISAMMRMDDTARNLLYMGTMSKNNRVSGIKLCPHESMMASSVTASSDHL